jgi:hypothetical protein
MSESPGRRTGHQFSAELLKARSGFALPTLLAVNLAITATSQNGTTSKQLPGSGPVPASALAGASHTVVGLGFAGSLFAMLFGAILVTNEYRSGAIGRSVVHAPSRTALLSVKFGVSAIGGLLVGAASAGGALLVAWLAFRTHHVSLVMDGRTWTICGAIVLVCLFAGPWGAAFGFLLRSQVLAILSLVVWTALAETMILSNFPSVGRFLPGGAQDAVMGDPTFPQRLAAPYGVLLLLAWGAAAALAAQQAFARRDLV